LGEEVNNVLQTEPLTIKFSKSDPNNLRTSITSAKGSVDSVSFNIFEKLSEPIIPLKPILVKSIDHGSSGHEIHAAVQEAVPDPTPPEIVIVSEDELASTPSSPKRNY